jgi:cell division protein FtsB
MAKSRGGPAGRAAGMGRRILAVLVIAGVVWFAVQGGEYGTFDLMSQRTRRERLHGEIDSLTRAVDSLAKWKKSIETDPVVQERIAREEFGMVRGNKELLYRFIAPSDTGR